MERTAALGLIAAAGLVAAAIGVRLLALDPLATARRNAQTLDEDVLRSPGPDVLQIAAMEHAPAWSDLLWLQIVQELGKPVEGEQASYDRLQRWANIAVDLDPNYFTVYWASAINLIAHAKRARAAEVFLKKAHTNLPDRWEFPFLLGYVFLFLRDEPTVAAEWWRKAIPLHDSPRFLPSLVARARDFSGDNKGAIELLEMMMDTLEGAQKEDAELRLKLLKSEVVLKRYDEACQRYLTERGRRPVDGAELYSDKYVEDEPHDFLGKPIAIDEKCRARTEYITVREDEAKDWVAGHRLSKEELDSERGTEASGKSEEPR